MTIEECIEKIDNVIEKYLHTEDKDFQIGLLTGSMGITLFSYYYARVKGKENLIADKFLDKTLELCVSTVQIATYCDGIAGIGFGIEHLSQHNFIETDTNFLLTDFDAYLSKCLSIYLEKKNYDFLHGSIGLGEYFLKRAVVNKESRKWIEYIIHELKANMHKGSGTEIKWLSNILNRDRNGYRQVYNISLSHGMSAILYFLMKSYAMGIFKEETSIMMSGIAEYILNQEIDKNKYGSYFPSYSIESDEIKSGSRLAWCYGDLGIATTLYQAGKTLQENAWIEKALEILTFAATQRRNPDANYVADAGLCHGAAGIGHIFYRMWWNTKLPEFKNAADYWFEQTLKMARFPDGVAGFKAFEMSDGETIWVNRYEFLTGVTGIGLALLTYYYELEPVWDECLLLS
jgi:lantibiotic modifying enzyme